MDKKTQFRFFAIILTLLCSLPFHAQTQLEWVAGFGGSIGDDYSQSLATDTSGNIYATGFFEGTVDFDPGSGVFNLVSAGNSQDVFVSKFDVSGNLLWAKQFMGPSNEVGISIALDSSGNIYVMGVFFLAVDFDPGPGSDFFQLVSDGSVDIFICKLDPLGNFIWAKKIGGPGIQYSHSLALDSSDNIYIAGHFENSVDLDPDPSPDDYILTSQGLEDIFVAKYNSNGNFIWGKQIGGAESEIVYYHTVDDSGNIYLTGSFLGTVDFDSGSGISQLTSAGMQDVFVNKMDSSGNFDWAKQIGGPANDEGFSIDIDNLGNVYVSGYFEGTADLDPGPNTFNVNSSGLGDVFVSKLDSSGNFLWGKGFGGNGYDFSLSSISDLSGNIYLTGVFEQSVDFDPGSSTANLSSMGGTDFFISKFSSSGSFEWAESFGGTGHDRSGFIGMDMSGKIILTGMYANKVDFDPSSNTSNLTSSGFRDVFVLKLTENLGTEDVLFQKNKSLYPNPAKTHFYIAGKENLAIEKVVLYDVLGNKLKLFQSAAQAYDISGLQKGVYFVKISSEGKSFTRKLIKK